MALSLTTRIATSLAHSFQTKSETSACDNPKTQVLKERKASLKLNSENISNTTNIQLGHRDGKFEY